MRLFMMAGAMLIGATSAFASDQPYAGQQARDIASLSQSDIDVLLAGGGWGLAKPAELNGYPGPAHILELADELQLSAEQLAQVTQIFEAMQKEAQALGRVYVDTEAHLSKMFRAGHANPAMLTSLLDTSSKTLADLRNVHLSAHLKATPLLTEAQRQLYAELRGYGDSHGHDAKHNHSGDH